MSASITLQSRLKMLDKYIQDYFVDSNTYFYSGRPFPWDEEDSPDVANSAQLSDVETRRAIIYLKKMSDSDVIKCIKRFDWETGIVYTPVDNDRDYTDFRNWISPEQPFYVMNSEGNVYKCISNNYGAASTEEPTLQSTGYTLTADGYIWKFMFNLSTNTTNKFLTDNWIPVPEDARRTSVHVGVVDAAVPGSIPYVRVDTQGENYSGTPIITIEGDGTGAEAVAVLQSGAIVGITITNEGQDYTYADVHIAGFGSGATASAQIAPETGHGSDAVLELGAFFLETSIELLGDTDGYPAWSTFRNVGLLNAPKDTNGDDLTVDNLTNLNTINIEYATGSFAVNEWVIGEDSEIRGKLYYDEAGDDTFIYLFDMNGVFTDGENLHGQESEVSALFHETGSVYSIFDPMSGDLLYKENIQFITRNTIQIEKFVFTMEF